MSIMLTTRDGVLGWMDVKEEFRPCSPVELTDMVESMRKELHEAKFLLGTFGLQTAKQAMQTGLCPIAGAMIVQDPVFYVDEDNMILPPATSYPEGSRAVSIQTVNGVTDVQDYVDKQQGKKVYLYSYQEEGCVLKLAVLD